MRRRDRSSLTSGVAFATAVAMMLFSLCGGVDAIGVHRQHTTKSEKSDSSPTITAEMLFYGRATSRTAAPAGKPQHTGLQFKILQQTPTGKEVEVNPELPFHTGDKVRFVFTSNTDGYLYVVQHGSSDQWTVLFPSADVNDGKNGISAFHPYAVPSNGWFAFDATPGTEEVRVYLSKEPLKELPDFRAPAVKTSTLTQAAVDKLDDILKSRDLVFQKVQSSESHSAEPHVEQATFVANRVFGQPVAAKVQLVHK